MISKIEDVDDTNVVSVAITDFDIIRKIERTFAHTKCGTQGYISPEIMGGNEYGVRSDIWSLGVVIIELMNGGKIISESKVMGDIAYELNCRERQTLVHKKIRKALQARKVYSEELINQVLKMISFTPKDRGTCVEILKWCKVQNPSRDDKSYHLTEKEQAQLSMAYETDAILLSPRQRKKTTITFRISATGDAIVQEFSESLLLSDIRTWLDNVCF